MFIRKMGDVEEDEDEVEEDEDDVEEDGDDVEEVMVRLIYMQEKEVVEI